MNAEELVELMDDNAVFVWIKLEGMPGLQYRRVLTVKRDELVLDDGDGGLDYGVIANIESHEIG